MSADSVPSSKTNIFQNKLTYCRHFRTYSRCAMFDWSDMVFRWRNVTRRRISITVLQPRYWGREADSPEVCRLQTTDISRDFSLRLSKRLADSELAVIGRTGIGPILKISVLDWFLPYWPNESFYIVLTDLTIFRLINQG
jgi:hypothetical protein